jgi:hypothetical protein
MGAQQVTNADQDEPGVSFLIGAHRAHVLILRATDLAIRNAIIDAILNLTTLRNNYQLVYLAAPRLLGATIDAALFRSHGMGLLFFDERRIEETLAPQPTELPKPVPSTQPQDDRAMVSELASLKTMYMEMERTLAQLRDDLANLRSAATLQTELPQPTQTFKPAAPQQIFVQQPIRSEELPSYFSNNPWLEVLSKRGSGGHEPIAG